MTPDSSTRLVEKVARAICDSVVDVTSMRRDQFHGAAQAAIAACRAELAEEVRRETLREAIKLCDGSGYCVDPLHDLLEQMDGKKRKA